MKRFLVTVWVLGFFYTMYVRDVRGFETGGLEQWAGLAIIFMSVSFVMGMTWIFKCVFSD